MIWKQYSEGKQTYGQLAMQYGRCPRTIQRKVDLAEVVTGKKNPRSIVVLMDTTYWGRSFGVMLFKDALTKENLLKYYVVNETNALYLKGIRELQDAGFTVTAIVCDGRKGLIGASCFPQCNTLKILGNNL